MCALFTLLLLSSLTSHVMLMSLSSSSLVEKGCHGNLPLFKAVPHPSLLCPPLPPLLLPSPTLSFPPLLSSPLKPCWLFHCKWNSVSVTQKKKRILFKRVKALGRNAGQHQGQLGLFLASCVHYIYLRGS